MESNGTEKVTTLLKAWAAGDTEAQHRLIPLVYNELKRLAGNYRFRAGAGDTMQTTVLVNEAYLRLVGIDDVDWQDRKHFFAIAADVMRRILVDAARGKGAAKRGGGAIIDQPELDLLPSPDSARASELVALDEALTLLAGQDPRRARVVELRVFGGLTVEETAEVMQTSPQTIMRDWKLAKAWLLRELSQ